MWTALGQGEGEILATDMLGLRLTRKPEIWFQVTMGSRQGAA
jgi:hypothetical protein